MKHIVLASAAAAALAVGGCSWFHSDRSEAGNTASPWDSDATRARQAAELQLNSSAAPPTGVAAGSIASGATSGRSGGSAARMSRGEVKQIQQTMKTAGLYQGPIDGIAGPQTKQAITAFQQAHNLPPTGTLDQQTATLLERSPTAGTGTTTPPSTGAGESTAPQNRSGTAGVSPSGEPNSASGSPSDARQHNAGTSGGAQGGQR